MQVNFNNTYNNINNYRIQKNYSLKPHTIKTSQNVNFKGLPLKKRVQNNTSTIKSFFTLIKNFLSEFIPDKTPPKKLIPQQQNAQNIFYIIKNDEGLLKKYKNILELPKNFIIDTRANATLCVDLTRKGEKVKSKIGGETIDKINNLLKGEQQINWDYIINSSNNSPSNIKQ